MLPKPNISLDEFLTDPTLDDILEPPRQVLLRSTGEFEILKPLAYWEAPKTERLYIAAAPQTALPSRSRSMWLLGSILGGGILVVLGLAMVGMFVLRDGFSTSQEAVTSEPAAITQPNNHSETQPESQAAVDEPPDQDVKTTDLATPADQPVEEEIVIASDETRDPATGVRSKRPAQVASTKTNPRAVPQPRLRSADRATTFVPSKTVIYVENGQVKQRVEPQSRNTRKN